MTDNMISQKSATSYCSLVHYLKVMRARYKILFVTFLVYLLRSGYIPITSKVSFICKDPKISHPFTGDTISGKLLLWSLCLGPFLVITIVEILEKSSLKKVSMTHIWGYYKECLTGTTLVLLLTELIKLTVREPRPHFLHSCKPDLGIINCQEGTEISEYVCGENNSNLSDLTKSFPSGHTSGSVFVAIYCCYIIQKRLTYSEERGSLVKPLLVALCITWSLLCSISRITDRRHHWWDVLAGAVLGLCGAWYSLKHLQNKQQHQESKSQRNISK